MKFCIPLILIFVTLVSANPLDKEHQDVHQNEDEIMKNCTIEFNIPLSKYVDELQDSFKLPHNDPNIQCFAKCALEKLGMFDNESGFKVDVVENKFKSKSKDQHTAENDFKTEKQITAVKCAKSTNEGTYANSCERAYSGAECFINELREKHFERNPEAKYKMECAEELKIPSSQMEYFDTYKKNRNNPTFHCFVKCFYEKMGILEKNKVGTPLVQYLYKTFAGGSEKDPSGDNLVKLEKCTKETNQGANINECESVFRVIECILDTIDIIRGRDS